MQVGGRQDDAVPLNPASVAPRHVHSRTEEADAVHTALHAPLAAWQHLRLPRMIL